MALGREEVMAWSCVWRVEHSQFQSGMEPWGWRTGDASELGCRRKASGSGVHGFSVLW